MKILSLPTGKEHFSEMSDFSVGLLGAYKVCSHSCTPVKSFSLFCFWMGGVSHSMFFFSPFIPVCLFNIDLHILAHVVKRTGLVKSSKPQLGFDFKQIREVFIVFKN